MIIAIMKKDDISVRELAQRVGVSEATVETIRSALSNFGVKSMPRLDRSRRS